MKKILVSIICLFVGCCLFLVRIKETQKDVSEEIDKLALKIDSMSIDEKIGQMFIVQYRKPVMDEDLQNILKTVKPGGFIFFSENFKDYEQTIKLIDDIKSYADIPMFLSIDQEGGRVQRLKNLKGSSITTIPSMASIGALGDEKIAYNTGSIMGKELSQFGINMDFAPVLDINAKDYNTVIGDRSFGSDYALVSKMGLSLGKGLSDNGVIPVYKHFPGHGSTRKDSHVELPILNKTKQELLDLDIRPFKEAIDNKAKVIMIGHLAVPSITGDNTPASLSKEIINDLLKKELEFDGLVITDALNMSALTKNYTQKEIYEMAINAGVNLLLMPEDAIEAFNIVKELWEEGSISEEQIDISVKKILSLKSERLDYSLE